MSMLDYLKTEQTIDVQILPFQQFDNYSRFIGDDTENGQSFRVNVTTDDRFIILGIVQSIDGYNLACMTEQQRSAWLAIVSGEIKPYLIKCNNTPGKRSGLSYNLSWDKVCIRYHAKKYALLPKVIGFTDNGIVGIKWANKTMAIFPNGNVVYR